MKAARVWIACFLLLASAPARAQLDLDQPDLEPPPEKQAKGDVGLGSFGSLSLGGLLDLRYVAAGDGAPGTMVHVDELVITANIGDRISILAEQLLPTSQLEGLDGVIGEDHGFVYAIFSGLPLLPAGTAFKIGRFRFKWGIDAALDGPANPVYSLARKNLGFITDRGIELSGFIGPLDYTVGLADGPEFVETTVLDAAGNPIGAEERNVENDSLPFLARISTSPGFSSRLRLGGSYFDGRSWGYVNYMPVMPGARLRVRMPGGMADRSMLVYRQHGAVDAALKWGKLGLSLEYSRGRDRVPGAGDFDTNGYLARVDCTVKPQKLAFLAQYDRYDDGRPGIKDEQAVSAAAQIFVHDQAYLRLGYIFNRIDPPSGPTSLAEDDVLFVQAYLPF